MKKQVSFDSADGILDPQNFATAASRGDNCYDYSDVSTETELRCLKTDFFFKSIHSAFLKDLINVT